METLDLKPLAVVTGASSGIGYELAKHAIHHGYDLVIAADEASIVEAKQAFEGLGARVEAVQTDLSGLATGGGIGVLATVKGVTPGNVDLIAPAGTVDAGDAGIRVSGNLNIAAAQVLNAANIQVSGSSAGTPSTPAAPSVATVNNAANTAATADAVSKQETAPKETTEIPEIVTPDSEITVEVIGYGGDGEPDEEDDAKKDRREGDPSAESEKAGP